MNNFIQLLNINKNFDSLRKVKVLKKISYKFNKGKIYSLMGPSGSGKSTLLGLLAGLDSPSGGEIFFDDMPLHSMSEDSRSKIRKESVAFVFQNFELLAGLTALENVMLPLEMKNNRKAREIAEKYLEKVDMLNRTMHYPQQLSGGEQQRVAIARAFACEAKVLFCDEPTGNLDSTNSKMISDLLFDVFNESSTALIIVTHDEDLADRCDQKIRLIDGKIQ